MVDVEKQKTAAETDDGVKPIKSTIAVDFNNDDDAIDYFALCGIYGNEIKQYIAANFKKEITDLDVLNFSIFLCNAIVTAETDDEKADIISDITDIVNDKYKLNEYIFTRLATIKSWNETTAALFGKKDVTEKEFNELMNDNVERNQYIAWNDERKILDAYADKMKSAKGGLNGEC